MKNDSYRQARGGWSRILDIACEKCAKRVCFYQKDGPGALKRMYFDRMIDYQPVGLDLIYQNCGETLGVKIIYQKENRPAYRLFQSSINKKIIKQAGRS